MCRLSTHTSHIHLRFSDQVSRLSVKAVNETLRPLRKQLWCEAPAKGIDQLDSAQRNSEELCEDHPEEQVKG